MSKRKGVPTPGDVRRVTDPMTKDDPIYAMTCNAANVHYGYPYHVEPRFLTDHGTAGWVLDVDQFWLSEQGVIYEWHEESETFVQVGTADSPPPGLTQRIIDATRGKGLVLAPSGITVLTPGGGQ